MKKVLLTAPVASMIYKFNMNSIDILQGLGYREKVACNFGQRNSMKEKEILKFQKILEIKNVHYDPQAVQGVFGKSRIFAIPIDSIKEFIKTNMISYIVSHQ